MELLFPFVLLIGIMLLMTRSAKNKQRQAAHMRDSMEPGTGVRTIGGMYALVKEVHEDIVVLEIAPGVQAVYAKNSIGAVLDPEEYERVISGEPPFDEDAPVVPDDASALTEDGVVREDDRVGLDKPENAGDTTPEATPEDEPKSDSRSEDSRRDGENGSKP
ncbi:preprotein translocase subunit YajC [Streptomyces sp. ACA25]|uniref:preprotein translocase subunit YajC n=1 Tax=Streptomyces sp. ACA25 TaxID=3022596 RepID=UPI0023082EA4|nr:preprotein translocase subunit YajC [Streptomyces sp. ACA25]MDB1088936.1 preprotein translocase subunit YajC [Streptomyces sp. ACA25]